MCGGQGEAIVSADLSASSFRPTRLTLVPRAIKNYQDAHPDIAVTLQIVSSANVRELVVERGFDIGLAADEVDLSIVEHVKFAITRAVCVMPPGHPLADLEMIAPRDLVGFRSSPSPPRTGRGIAWMRRSRRPASA